MRNGEPFFAIAVVAVLVVAAWVAKSTGAGFVVVLTACTKTLIPLVLAGAVSFFGVMRVSSAFLIALVFIYPLWWPVLDSIALEGNDNLRLEWLQHQMPWWTSTWFKVVSELMLIGGVVYWFFQDGRYR